MILKQEPSSSAGLQWTESNSPRSQEASQVPTVQRARMKSDFMRLNYCPLMLLGHGEHLP